MMDNSTTFSIWESKNPLTEVIDSYATDIFSKRLDEAILYFIHKYNLTMSDMKKNGGIIERRMEDGSIIIDIIYKMQKVAKVPDYKCGKYKESLVFRFDTNWEIK